MPQNYFLPIILVLMVVMMLFMSRSAKKQQQAAAQQRKEALKVGTSVLTRAGMYGQIVEIDGEAIVLASPSGDESIWHSSSVLRAEEPPFSLMDESVEEPVVDPTFEDSETSREIEDNQ